MFADFRAFCPGSDANSCRTAASLACRVSASVPESLLSSFSDTTCCLSCACAGPDMPVSVITKATARARVNVLGNMRLMPILLNLSHHWLGVFSLRSISCVASLFLLALCSCRNYFLDAKRARKRPTAPQDRKSTRLNSSHSSISYAVFCLKKKKNNNGNYQTYKESRHRREE